MSYYSWGVSESKIDAELPEDRGIELLTRNVNINLNKYDELIRKLICEKIIFYNGKKYKLIEVEDK